MERTRITNLQLLRFRNQQCITVYEFTTVGTTGIRVAEKFTYFSTNFQYFLGAPPRTTQWTLPQTTEEGIPSSRPALVVLQLYTIVVAPR